ncbi:pentapeptide repeat-containing protein [Spirillospora sp. NPDC049024]
MPLSRNRLRASAIRQPRGGLVRPVFHRGRAAPQVSGLASVIGRPPEWNGGGDLAPMADYVTTRSGVRSWPAAPDARAALEEYLDALAVHSEAPGRGPLRVPPALEGDFLDFSGADLSGLDLGSAGLFGAGLEGVRLVGANLNRATLNGALLNGADLTSAVLFRAVAFECEARGAVFRGCDLIKADLSRTDMREADLRETELMAVYLARADLRGADLRDCSFGPAERTTSLSHARLAGCRVAGASGHVHGPVDVGADAPALLDGAELRDWFRSMDAPGVAVAPSG